MDVVTLGQARVQGDRRYALSPGVGVAPAQPRFGVATVISNFASGHGFTLSNAAGTSNLNDTSDSIQSAQSVKIATSGTAAFTTLKKTGLTAVDTTGKHIRIWIKTSDIANINTLQVYAAPAGGLAGSQLFAWTIHNGTSPSASLLQVGEWTSVSLDWASSTKTGTPARTAITEWQVAVRDQNGVAVTIQVGGIHVYPNGMTRYPNGVVALCFDDGYVGHWTLARPILAGYGYPATLLPIIDRIDTSPWLSTAQLLAFQDKLGWEVGTHAFTLANHSAYNTITDAQAVADLLSAQQWLRARGFRGGSTFGFPLGYFGSGRDAAVAPYVACGRTIASNSNIRKETIPVGIQNRIRSMAPDAANTIASLLTASGPLDALVTERSALIMTIHDVSASATGTNNLSTTDLQSLVDGCATRGISVVTLGELMQAQSTGS